MAPMRASSRLGARAVVSAALLLGCEAGEDAGPLAPWDFEDLIGVSNLDDDDGDGQQDWLQPPFAADDDCARWVMPAQAEAELLSSYTFAPDGGDEVFAFEFAGTNDSYTLELSHLDAAGEVLVSSTVALRSAPLIINHHLQPAEHLWAVAVNLNTPLTTAYAEALGEHFTAVPGASVGGDVWIQDEIEFGTVRAPSGARTELIIDSIRDRGLDSFPDQITGPGRFKQTWGVPGTQTSSDSFGNLEATPPITVAGVAYPFGRIYYGKQGDEGLNEELASFLDAQRVQAPVELDTSWLCVGHVDEFSSFVPDPGAAKGFKALLADVDAAYALFEGLDPSLSLPRYADAHGYATVGELLADEELRALNHELRDDHLAPIRAEFEAQFGLDASDIIGVPMIFEQVALCGGRVVALVPGMVNLIVANFEGEAPKLFVPDPFVRADNNDLANDPLAQRFTELMPAGSEVIFVDDWFTYHLALGEVHCGTNLIRSSRAEWWELAAHLLD